MGYYQKAISSMEVQSREYEEIKDDFTICIIDEVCRIFRIDSDMIYEKNRTFHVKSARWFIWKVLEKQGFTYSRIARMFGYDHSTVICALKQLEIDLKNMDVLKEKWERVEEYLKNRHSTQKSAVNFNDNP